MAAAWRLMVILAFVSIRLSYIQVLHAGALHIVLGP